MRLRNKYHTANIGVVAVLALMMTYTGAAAQRTGVFTDIQSQEIVFGGHPGGDAGDGPVRDISFELFVPPDYDPADPPGVLVFISPVIRAKAPDRLHAMLGEQNLIWISVNDSGDRTEDFERMLEAYGSLAYVLDHYTVNVARRYLAGFASGAHVASQFAQDYPQFFNGYLFFGGARNWQNPPDGNFRLINRHRFAFVAGVHDQGLKRTRDAFDSFENAGVDHIALVEVDGLGHRLPDAADFSEAVDFLEQHDRR